MAYIIRPKADVDADPSNFRNAIFATGEDPVEVSDLTNGTAYYAQEMVLSPAAEFTPSDAPMPVFSDDFDDGVDGEPISSSPDWIEVLVSNEFATIRYFEGQARYLRSSGGWIRSILSASVSLQADQFSRVTVNTLPGANQSRAYATVRETEGDCYFSCLDQSGKVLIGKWIDGTETFLGEWDYTLSLPNQIECRAEGEELSAYVDGVFIGSITDSDLSGGRAGFKIRSDNAISAILVDDFNCGNL